MDFISTLDSLSNIVTVLVTACVTWAGSFLFYRQRRDSLDIENESKQSDEWRKLYLESQEDSRKKDEKIDELRKEMVQLRKDHAKEMDELRKRMITLERREQLNSIYRCEIMDCPRRPRPQQIEEENQNQEQ